MISFSIQTENPILPNLQSVMKTVDFVFLKFSFIDYYWINITIVFFQRISFGEWLRKWWRKWRGRIFRRLRPAFGKIKIKMKSANFWDNRIRFLTYRNQVIQKSKVVICPTANTMWSVHEVKQDLFPPVACFPSLRVQTTFDTPHATIKEFRTFHHNEPTFRTVMKLVETVEMEVVLTTSVLDKEMTALHMRFWTCNEALKTFPTGWKVWKTNWIEVCR